MFGIFLEIIALPLTEIFLRKQRLQIVQDVLSTIVFVPPLPVLGVFFLSILSNIQGLFWRLLHPRLVFLTIIEICILRVVLGVGFYCLTFLTFLDDAVNTT